MPRPYDIRERARLFAKDAYAFGEKARARSRHLAHFAEQLVRAAASVGANLEEAKDGQSKPDFISKNSIALKEAREARYWLRLTHDVDAELRTDAEPLIAESGEIIAILTAIVKKAKLTAGRGT